jgi:hypothetical protein
MHEDPLGRFDAPAQERDREVDRATRRANVLVGTTAALLLVALAIVIMLN